MVMVWTTATKSSATIKPLVEQIFLAGKMSRQDYFQLTSVILADRGITSEERRQINRILDCLQTGRLKIAD